jgi:DHA1 family tetracycline resistance protein-like MFS transporter
MRKNPILPIFLIVFTNILGGGMVLPVLPLYAVDFFGGSEFQAALLATAFNAAMFVAAPWLGRLSDRHGRRPVLMISQMGTIISFLMFIVAAPVGAVIDGTGINLGMRGGMLIFFLARILDGFTGGNITTAQAYASDVTTEENRTQALGLVAAAFGMGFIFGPAIGGLLGGISTLAPFIGAVSITTVTFLLTTFVLKESLTKERREASRVHKAPITFRQAIANRDYLLVVLLGFIQLLAYSAIPPNFSLYASHVFFAGETDIAQVSRNVGLLLSCMGIYNVITQVCLLKPLVARFGERNLIAIGQTVFLVAMFTFPLFANPYYAALMFAPLAFGRAVSDPSLQSLVTRFGTDRTRGRLLGIYQSALSMAFILGPIWGGWVFEKIAPSAIYQLGGIIVIPAVILAHIIRRRPLPLAAEGAAVSVRINSR